MEELNELMGISFEIKDKISEGDYLKICNGLKTLHDKLNKKENILDDEEYSNIILRAQREAITFRNLVEQNYRGFSRINQINRIITNIKHFYNHKNNDKNPLSLPLSTLKKVKKLINVNVNTRMVIRVIKGETTNNICDVINKPILVNALTYYGFTHYFSNDEDEVLSLRLCSKDDIVNLFCRFLKFQYCIIDGEQPNNVNNIRWVNIE